MSTTRRTSSPRRPITTVRGTAEGNITRTISYTYDTAGNILSETKTVGSKTTTKTFSYTDSNWKDLLTGIDDQKLVYDASGNPTTYRNGTSVYYDMEWVNGRQLSFVECYYGSQSRSYYSYDASGIRSEKIVEMPGEVISYSYITQSGKVIRETVDDDHSIAILDFVYDESGKPFAMIDQRSAQPKTYYYVLNLQGDVVKLIDQDGAVAASYEYDAWGQYSLAVRQHGRREPPALPWILLRFRNRVLLPPIPLLRPRNP